MWGNGLGFAFVVMFLGETWWLSLCPTASLLRLIGRRFYNRIVHDSSWLMFSRKLNERKLAVQVKYQMEAPIEWYTCNGVCEKEEKMEDGGPISWKEFAMSCQRRRFNRQERQKVHRLARKCVRMRQTDKSAIEVHHSLLESNSLATFKSRFKKCRFQYKKI